MSVQKKSEALIDMIKYEASLDRDRNKVRVHKKRDGLLLIDEQGKIRFMTMRERLAFWLLGNKTEIKP